MGITRSGSQPSDTGTALDGKAVEWLEDVTDEQYEAGS